MTYPNAAEQRMINQAYDDCIQFFTGERVEKLEDLVHKLKRGQYTGRRDFYKQIRSLVSSELDDLDRRYSQRADPVEVRQIIDQGRLPTRSPFRLTLGEVIDQLKALSPVDTGRREELEYVNTIYDHYSKNLTGNRLNSLETLVKKWKNDPSMNRGDFDNTLRHIVFSELDDLQRIYSENADPKEVRKVIDRGRLPFNDPRRLKLHQIIDQLNTKFPEKENLEEAIAGRVARYRRGRIKTWQSARALVNRDRNRIEPESLERYGSYIAYDPVAMARTEPIPGALAAKIARDVSDFVQKYKQKFEGDPRHLEDGELKRHIVSYLKGRYPQMDEEKLVNLVESNKGKWLRGIAGFRGGRKIGRAGDWVSRWTYGRPVENIRSGTREVKETGPGLYYNLSRTWKRGRAGLSMGLGRSEAALMHLREDVELAEIENNWQEIRDLKRANEELRVLHLTKNIPWSRLRGQYEENSRKILSLEETNRKLKEKSPAYARTLKAAGTAYRGFLGLKVPKGPVKTTGRRDPLMQSAINKGKRELSRRAKRRYKEIYYNIDREAASLTKEVENARKSLEEIIKKANSQPAVSVPEIADTVGQLLPVDKIAKVVSRAAGQLEKGGRDPAILAQSMRDAHSDLKEAREKLEKLQDRFGYLNKKLLEELKKDAEGIAADVSSKYNIEKDKLAPVLESEAQTLANYWTKIARGKMGKYFTMAHRAAMRAGEYTATAGEAYMQVLENIWRFFTGPWVVGSIFLMIQFFFIMAYVGYNLTYLWIFPIIGAAFTLILNFSESFRPFDWLTHLISGAMIGYSSLLFMLAFYVPKLSFFNLFWLWIIWIGLGALGLFQFYQTGGFRTVFMGSIFILLFAYVALGPYSGYYQTALHQVGQPLEIAYRAVSRAVEDVWLLATNPTEWYARQQVVNVRPERTLAFAKAVEIKTLDSIPQSVPGGQEFAITAVISNEGMEEAKDLKVSVGCDTWCSTKYVNVLESARHNGAFSLNKKNLKRGESVPITVQSFVSNSLAGREVEFRTANIDFNINYEHYTSSTLSVEVISKKELNKRFFEGEDVFRNRVAIAKVTPAQVSLNVGPQPLVAASEAILLVSVSNQRDDTSIFLKEGEKIIITMPRVVGNNLKCPSSEVIEKDDEKETIVYIVPKPIDGDQIEILEYDFNSIFAFSCTFRAAPITEDSQTGLVTVSLPKYIVESSKEKLVPITPPIGIIADPQDKICRKCGEGANKCDEDACYDLSADSSDPSLTCWFNSRGPSLSAVCESCKPDTVRSCGQFRTSGDCESQSLICGMACRWDPDVAHPITGLKDGACVNVPSEAPNFIPDGVCELPDAWISGYNKYGKDIKLAVENYGLAALVSQSRDHRNAEAIVAALISQESDNWNERSVSPCGAAGLLQFVPKTARGYGLSVPFYEFEHCSDICKIGGRIVDVSVCNSCSYECDWSGDERFNAGRAIDAGVHHITDLVRACSMGGGVTSQEVHDAISTYNGGATTDNPCPGIEANQGYTNKILKEYYFDWVGCFQKVRDINELRVSLGEEGYCEMIKSKNPYACDLGEGGCNDDSDCDQTFKGEGGVLLECRDVDDPSIKVNLCCYRPIEQTPDAYAHENEECVAVHNRKLSGEIIVTGAGRYPNSITAVEYASQLGLSSLTEATYRKFILGEARRRNTDMSPNYIVLHHTGGSSAGGALAANIGHGTNEHYIVDKDGTVISVIPEELSAQHANCLNSMSIGIEIVNEGDGIDQYTQNQIISLRGLVSYLIAKYNIQAGYLVGHGCSGDSKKPDEPTGLDPNFLPGWTIVKRSGSPVTCNLLC